MAFPGYATPEGTARYAARLRDSVADGHFRDFQGLYVSSIGLGTYLGEHDRETDAQYREAVARALALGFRGDTSFAAIIRQHIADELAGVVR